jgi:hypothetical protein
VIRVAGDEGETVYRRPPVASPFGVSFDSFCISDSLETRFVARRDQSTSFLLRLPAPVRRFAAEAPAVAKPGQPPESSAYPGDANFDPQQAQSIIGDVAENVRQFLANKLKVRPPGLQTKPGGGQTLTVIADNPDQGVGLEIEIRLLRNATPLSPPANETPPGFGIGPPPAGPGPVPQPPAAGPGPGGPMGPGMPGGAPGFGVGPTPF